jgi:hypothetical protein
MVILLVIVEEPHVHVEGNLRKEALCHLRKTVENITERLQHLI